jgi:hypothetical protein
MGEIFLPQDGGSEGFAGDLLWIRSNRSSLIELLDKNPAEFVLVFHHDLFQNKRDTQNWQRCYRILTDLKNFRKHIVTLLQSGFLTELFDLHMSELKENNRNCKKFWDLWIQQLATATPHFVKLMAGFYQHGTQKNPIILKAGYARNALRTIYSAFQTKKPSEINVAIDAMFKKLSMLPEKERHVIKDQRAIKILEKSNFVNTKSAATWCDEARHNWRKNFRAYVQQSLTHENLLPLEMNTLDSNNQQSYGMIKDVLAATVKYSQSLAESGKNANVLAVEALRKLQILLNKQPMDPLTDEDIDAFIKINDCPQQTLLP